MRRLSLIVLLVGGIACGSNSTTGTETSSAVGVWKLVTFDGKSLPAETYHGSADYRQYLTGLSITVTAGGGFTWLEVYNELTPYNPPNVSSTKSVPYSGTWAELDGAIGFRFSTGGKGPKDGTISGKTLTMSTGVSPIAGQGFTPSGVGIFSRQ